MDGGLAVGVLLELPGVGSARAICGESDALEGVGGEMFAAALVKTEALTARLFLLIQERYAGLRGIRIE